MGNSNQQILLEIKAKTDQALGELQKLQKEGLAGVSKQADNASGSFTDLAAKFYLLKNAATYLTAAFDEIKISAKVQDMQRAFNNMTASVGLDSQQFMQSMKEMSGGILSTAELLEKANYAKSLQIPLEKLPELMQIARASALNTGKDFSYMYDSIVMGVGRQSRMILDNLGIIVDSDKAYINYAKTLGKTADELTETEKKAAFMSEVLKQGNEVIKTVGISSKTASENMAGMGAGFVNVKNIVFNDFVSAMDAAAKSIGGVLDNYVKLREAEVNLTQTVKESALIKAKAMGVDAWEKDLPILARRKVLEDILNESGTKARLSSSDNMRNIKPYLNPSEKELGFQQEFIKLGKALSEEENKRFEKMSAILRLREQTREELIKELNIKKQIAIKTENTSSELTEEEIKNKISKKTFLPDRNGFNEYNEQIREQNNKRINDEIAVNNEFLEIRKRSSDSYMILEQKATEMSIKHDKQNRESWIKTAEIKLETQKKMIANAMLLIEYDKLQNNGTPTEQTWLPPKPYNDTRSFIPLGEVPTDEKGKLEYATQSNLRLQNIENNRLSTQIKMTEAGRQTGVELGMAALNAARMGQNVGEALGTLIEYKLQAMAVSMIFGFIGAAIGTIIGGPAGAAAGWQLGSGTNSGNPISRDIGGSVPGQIGSPQLILAHGGEIILPTHRMSASNAVDRFVPGSSGRSSTTIIYETHYEDHGAVTYQSSDENLLKRIREDNTKRRNRTTRGASL